MSSSRGSSQPRDQTCICYVSCIGRWVPKGTQTAPLRIQCPVSREKEEFLLSLWVGPLYVCGMHPSNLEESVLAGREGSPCPPSTPCLGLARDLACLCTKASGSQLPVNAVGCSQTAVRSFPELASRCLPKLLFHHCPVL